MVRLPDAIESIGDFRSSITFRRPSATNGDQYYSIKIMAKAKGIQCDTCYRSPESCHPWKMPETRSTLHVHSSV